MCKSNAIKKTKSALLLLFLKADLTGYPEISLIGAVVTASTYVGGNTADKVADGKYDSRWKSESADSQWLLIDLNHVETIGG